MKVGFTIIILPREAQVVVDCGEWIDAGFAEGRIAGTPGNCARCCVCQSLRRPQVIVVVVVESGIIPHVKGVGAPHCVGLPAIALLPGAAAAVFTDEAFVGVEVVGGD